MVSPWYSKFHPFYVADHIIFEKSALWTYQRIVSLNGVLNQQIKENN